jgi:hypothetical protein
MRGGGSGGLEVISRPIVLLDDKSNGIIGNGNDGQSQNQEVS